MYMEGGKVENSNYPLSELIKYPNISNELIECLKSTFPNKLPLKQISEFELGVLIGQQRVIDQLKIEKEYQEKE